MSLYVIGINHKTASINLREKAYFSQDKLQLYLQDLLGSQIAAEAVLLSTCNRSELYCRADQLSAVQAWFAQQTTLSAEELLRALYIYKDERAIAHIMEVACGLDSMILGEPQILGQMKEAFSESCTANAVGPFFYRLFQEVFAVAKEIRTTTAIGACPVSVASAAVHFAKNQLIPLKNAKVIVIGAGDTAALLLRYLQPLLETTIQLVNRNIETAHTLTEIFTLDVFNFDALPTLLQSADLVFSATGSALPIVNPGCVQAAMLARLARPLYFIDIAVPRDIHPDVSYISNVKLYCIDDLKVIIAQNRQGREHAAYKARDLIRQKSTAFMAQAKTFDHVSYTIGAYRKQVEAICYAELIKAKRALQAGTDPMAVIDGFAHAFIQKLLHAPSVQLREAGAQGRFELLNCAKELFAIPDPETERL